jgi:hypothetical protein
MRAAAEEISLRLRLVFACLIPLQRRPIECHVQFVDRFYQQFFIPLRPVIQGVIQAIAYLHKVDLFLDAPSQSNHLIVWA